MHSKGVNYNYLCCNQPTPWPLYVTCCELRSVEEMYNPMLYHRPHQLRLGCVGVSSLVCYCSLIVFVFGGFAAHSLSPKIERVITRRWRRWRRNCTRRTACIGWCMTRLCASRESTRRQSSRWRCVSGTVPTSIATTPWHSISSMLRYACSPILLWVALVVLFSLTLLPLLLLFLLLFLLLCFFPLPASCFCLQLQARDAIIQGTHPVSEEKAVKACYLYL